MSTVLLAKNVPQTNDYLKRKKRKKNVNIVGKREFWKPNSFCEVDQANEGKSSEARNNGAVTCVMGTGTDDQRQFCINYILLLPNSVCR